MNTFGDYAVLIILCIAGIGLCLLAGLLSACVILFCRWWTARSLLHRVDMQTSILTATELQTRVENRQRLAAMKSEIVKQMDAETEAIKAEMVASGEETREVGDYVVTLSVRDRKTLDKGALVALGVSTEVIAQATKPSTYMQVDVRKRAEVGA